MAVERTAFYDEILDDLVYGMPYMDITIGIRGPSCK